MKLSIIIPVLNEVQGLSLLLKQLRPLGRDGVEILIVDGESNDGSANIAERAGLTVLRSSRGRARQMNAGATAATGDVLLFLYADTYLPKDPQRLIHDALLKSGRVWGRFDVHIQGEAFMLRVISMLMNLLSRWSGIATGDRAMFVTRTAFERVGGFPEQPLMEDIELSRRLLALSRPACIKQQVTTSGRRWESRGVWRTIFLMWRLRFAYWRGVSPRKLANDYQ